jgi:hypothetical protein
LEKPALAKALEELSHKEPQETDAQELLSLFSMDEPRVNELREKVLEAARIATAYTV